MCVDEHSWEVIIAIIITTSPPLGCLGLFLQSWSPQLECSEKIGDLIVKRIVLLLMFRDLPTTESHQSGIQSRPWALHYPVIKCWVMKWQSEPGCHRYCFLLKTERCRMDGQYNWKPQQEPGQTGVLTTTSQVL